MKESNIIKFYRGEFSLIRPNLKDIWKFSDSKLEHKHFYIQWLFPLNESSNYNSHAPILTEYDIEVMKSDKEIKENILKSLRIILKFYGLKLENNNIRIAEEFKEKHTWITRKNHNFKRITRILKFLVLMDMKEIANSFFLTLSIIYENNKEVIGETSFNYWNRAIE